MNSKKKFKIFCGNANKTLAREICDDLGISLGKCLVDRFSDGEVRVELLENVRGHDIFVVQPTQPKAENIIELILLLDALKRASANYITAVIPYFGYARQDRKDKGRIPISAKAIAKTIQTLGADRVLTMDLHASQIQGFFDIPVDHIYGSSILVPYFRNLLREEDPKNWAICAPDAGSIKMARAYAKHLDVSLVAIDKRREKVNQSEVMHILGDPVQGKKVIIMDDMIDTAGTIVNAAYAVHNKGAKTIYAACTHGILSGPAVSRITKSPISKIITLNTVPHDFSSLNGRATQLSSARLFSEAISGIYHEESVSSLFLD